VSGIQLPTPSQSSLQSSNTLQQRLQRKPPSLPKTPTLPRHPHRLSRSLLFSPSLLINPPPLKPSLSSARPSSTPYSLLPRRLPSRPLLLLALVWTSSRLLVELNLLANSEKLNLLTLVLLLLLIFASVPVCSELLSLKLGTAVVEIDLEGSAMELGREPPVRDEVVPVRGRREVGGGLPWNASIAWVFKNGIGGLLGGDSVR